MRALYLIALAAASLPAPACELLKQKEVVDALCSKVSKFVPQDECEQGVQLVISKECPSTTAGVKALPAPVCELLKQEEVVDALCSKVAKYLPAQECSEVFALLVAKECPSQEPEKALPAPVCQLLEQKEVVDALCSKVSKYLPQDECEQGVQLVISKECPSTTADVKALPAPVCGLLKQKEVVDALCAKVTQFLPQAQCEAVMQALEEKECPSVAAVKALPAPVCELLKQEQVVDALCSKVSKYVPAQQCEAVVQLLAQKECAERAVLVV